VPGCHIDTAWPVIHIGWPAVLSVRSPDWSTSIVRE